jgi:hypothetical protein
MDTTPYLKISGHAGHLFDVSLVDRSDAGVQQWEVEVQMLNPEDRSPVGAVVMLSEKFISAEAARSAGNALARRLLAERFDTAG